MNIEGRDLGILVVGAGFLGAQRAAAAVAIPGARLVAVVDCDRVAARRLAAQLRSDVEPDLESALKRDDVDAVVVATPHADHAFQASAALEAGKHVLVEKPLAIDADSARSLALRADELRLRLATGLNHRFYPSVADMLALTESGAIGRVECVRAEIGHRASAAFLAGWHTDVERSGGGTLMDNGPHACDLIRRLLGEISAAKGYLRRDSGLPDHCEVEAFALFRDSERGHAELRSSWLQPTGYLGVEVRGSQGWLKVETAPWSLRGRLATGQRIHKTYLTERVAERVFRLRHGCERSLACELASFVATIREHAPAKLAATGWDGCRVTEMIDAVYRADATGAEVRLEPPLVHLPSIARRRALVGRST
jgi:predicted dehydrogenase